MLVYKVINFFTIERIGEIFTLPLLFDKEFSSFMLTTVSPPNIL